MQKHYFFYSIKNISYIYYSFQCVFSTKYKVAVLLLREQNSIPFEMVYDFLTLTSLLC